MVDPKIFGTKALLLYWDGSDFILSFSHGKYFCMYVHVF